MSVLERKTIMEIMKYSDQKKKDIEMYLKVLGLHIAYMIIISGALWARLAMIH